MTDRSRWRVYLGVRSAGLTADEVTRWMGVSPEHASSVAGRRWPHLWQADSGLSAEAGLEDHLNALIHKFRDRIDHIGTLARRPDCQVTIEAVLHFDAAGEDDPLPAMWIPPDAVTFAAACGIGIDIDSYLVHGSGRPFG